MENKNEDIRILSVKSDMLFKLMFFDEKDIEGTLKKLLKDCIEFDDKKLEEIILLDRGIDGETPADKSIILDINAKLSDGTLVNIELQRIYQGSFNERSIFYTSRRFASQGSKGSDYEDLKPTVALNIVDFNVFKDTDEFYSKFYLMEENRHTKLSEFFRIDYLELPKIKDRKIDKNNKKELWVRFFNAESKEELDMIKEVDPTFEKAVEKLVFLSSDPSVLTAYEQEEKMRMDESARLKHAVEQGIEKQLKETVFSMLEDDMTDKLICKFTHITQEKLEVLKLEFQEMLIKN